MSITVSYFCTVHTAAHSIIDHVCHIHRLLLLRSYLQDGDSARKVQERGQVLADLQGGPYPWFSMPCVRMPISTIVGCTPQSQTLRNFGHAMPNSHDDTRASYEAVEQEC